jgi:hypothetical protein
MRRATGPSNAAVAVAQWEGHWYCARHLAARRAVASKRRDRGFGACTISGCSRPAVKDGGKCVEHEAAQRAAGHLFATSRDSSGRGGHPYAPKQTELYLIAFAAVNLLKVGKATPWTLGARVNDAKHELQQRQIRQGLEPTTEEPRVWALALFGEQLVAWAVAERIEHATAGRLAHLTSAETVPHEQGKEWLAHPALGSVEWESCFRKAARETLTFFGEDEHQAGNPYVVREGSAPAWQTRRGPSASKSASA